MTTQLAYIARTNPQLYLRNAEPLLRLAWRELSVQLSTSAYYNDNDRVFQSTYFDTRVKGVIFSPDFENDNEPPPRNEEEREAQVLRRERFETELRRLYGVRDLGAFIDTLRVLVYEPNADQAYLEVLQHGSGDDIEEDEQQQNQPLNAPPRGRVVTVRFVLPTLVDVGNPNILNNIRPLLLPFTKNTEEQIRVIMAGRNPNLLNTTYGGILRNAWRIMLEQATAYGPPDMTRFHIFPLRDTIAFTPAVPIHFQLGAGPPPPLPPTSSSSSSSSPHHHRRYTTNTSPMESSTSSGRGAEYREFTHTVQRVYHPHPSEFDRISLEYDRDQRFLSRSHPFDRIPKELSTIKEDASAEAFDFYTTYLSHFIQPINFHLLSSTMCQMFRVDGLFSPPPVPTPKHGAFLCVYDIWTYRRFSTFFAMTLYIFLRSYAENLIENDEELQAFDISMTQVLSQKTTATTTVAVNTSLTLLDIYTERLDYVQDLIHQGLYLLLSKNLILDAFLRNVASHIVTITHRAHVRDLCYCNDPSDSPRLLTYFRDLTTMTTNTPLPAPVIDFLNTMPHSHTFIWFKFATMWSQALEVGNNSFTL